MNRLEAHRPLGRRWRSQARLRCEFGDQLRRLEPNLQGFPPLAHPCVIDSGRPNSVDHGRGVGMIIYTTEGRRPVQSMAQPRQ